MTKISKTGIAADQEIQADHTLRIIEALSGEVADTTIEVSGSITASYFVGDGSQLTNLPTSSGGGGNSGSYEHIPIYCSDLSTPVTVGTTKGFHPITFNGTLIDIKLNLLEAGTTNGMTVDINKNGSSILTTRLTTDAGQDTSDSASVSMSINDDSLNINDKITVDFDDQVPVGALCPVVTLIVDKN